MHKMIFGCARQFVEISFKPGYPLRTRQILSNANRSKMFACKGRRFAEAAAATLSSPA